MTADRIRVWLTVAVLGLLMLGSFWIFEVLRRHSDEQANASKVRTAPDYFIEGFNFVRLSQTGNTNYRVTGDKLTHFPQEDEFEITQPRIIGIDQEKTPMNMRADRAIVKQRMQETPTSHPEDQIHMLDNVVVERRPADETKHLKLETTSLILFPDSERMKTQQAIVLNTPNTHITAVGLEADNATQKIQFLHQLHMLIDNTRFNSRSNNAKSTGRSGASHTNSKN